MYKGIIHVARLPRKYVFGSWGLHVAHDASELELEHLQCQVPHWWPDEELEGPHHVRWHGGTELQAV